MEQKVKIASLHIPTGTIEVTKKRIDGVVIYYHVEVLQNGVIIEKQNFEEGTSNSEILLSLSKRGLTGRT